MKDGNRSNSPHLLGHVLKNAYASMALTRRSLRHNDSAIRIIGITEADAGRMFCSTRDLVTLLVWAIRLNQTFGKGKMIGPGASKPRLQQKSKIKQRVSKS